MTEPSKPPPPKGAWDADDATLVVWLVLRAALLIGAAATLGFAIRVFLWTSGLGG